MNKYIKCINYLISKKTNTIPHGNKNLFQHLINVYDKLKKWNCHEDICYAGLFHSIYGNNSFTFKTEADREIIKKLIGKKAELLVYLYNQDRYQNKQLQTISLANELDQNFIYVLDNYFDKEDISKIYFYFRDTVPWKFIGSGRDETKWRKFKYDLMFKNKIENKFKKDTENILKNLKFFKDHKRKEYALEELIAEIGANLLCIQFDMQKKVNKNSLAYLKSWITALKNDDVFIYKALSQSAGAIDFLKKNLKENKAVKTA